MFEIFGNPSQVLFGQLLLGLINGSFYALLSLGLAVIFGMLNIINFTHGAQYMMGAFAAYMLMQYLGLNYWVALIVVPILIGFTGILIERLLLKRLQNLDHLYGLILTFGLALIIEGVFRNYYGSSGQPYQMPDELRGGRDLGFMFLPNYRAWVIAFSLMVCFGTWFAIERTRLGSYLRAATENPTLVRAFGINVPRMVTLTYGFGVGLAALAGVMAAPIYNVSPQMGSDIIIVVFAVVVIGGMGSITGRDPDWLRARHCRRPDQSVFPGSFQHRHFRHHDHRAASQAGRLVRTERVMVSAADVPAMATRRGAPWSLAVAAAVMVVFLVAAPFVLYPVFLMKALVLCAVRLRLQSLDRLCRAALVRPCAVFRLGELPRRLCGQVLGPAARTGHPCRHGDRRRARPHCRRRRHPPPGHLFRHDHAGAGADDVSRRACG